VIYSCEYGCMSVYFILWAVIWLNCHLFCVTKWFQLWPLGAPLVLSICLPSFCETFLTPWHYKVVLAHLMFFLLDQPLLQGAPIPLIVLRDQHRALHELIGTEISLPPGTISRQLGNRVNPSSLGGCVLRAQLKPQIAWNPLCTIFSYTYLW
jgi:hypothetical protein